jgi:F-type H+-transporting ATPase subunit epsilon
VAEKVLILDIVTPDRNLFSGEVKMVVAPAAEGEVGILPLHAPFLAELNVGELRYTFDKNGQPAEEYVAVDGGFMQVFEDKVTVIAPSAEYAREIDVERAKAAQAEAKEEIKSKEGADVEKAKITLLRAESRLRIARRLSK